MQVMLGPLLSSLHALNSFERHKSWSLGISEMEVASVQQPGGTEGPQHRPLERSWWAGNVGESSLTLAGGMTWVPMQACLSEPE